jgi:DNA-binding IclR family transcriptional regulator
MSLRNLQALGVADILLDLLANGPAQKADLRRRTGLSWSTIHRAHKILFDAGMLAIDPHPDLLVFMLSESGTKVAESLRQAVVDWDDAARDTAPE